MRNVGMDKAKRMVNGENAAERDSLQKIYDKQIYTLKASIKEKDKKNREILFFRRTFHVYVEMYTETHILAAFVTRKQLF